MRPLDHGGWEKDWEHYEVFLKGRAVPLAKARERQRRFFFHMPRASRVYHRRGKVGSTLGWGLGGIVGGGGEHTPTINLDLNKDRRQYKRRGLPSLSTSTLNGCGSTSLPDSANKPPSSMSQMDQEPDWVGEPAQTHPPPTIPRSLQSTHLDHGKCRLHCHRAG